MLVVLNFFLVVSIISAQMTVFCIKMLTKRGRHEESYRKVRPEEEEEVEEVKKEKEVDLLTAREAVSTETAIEETCCSPGMKTARSLVDGLQLVPRRTEEQKNLDERNMQQAAGVVKKRKKCSTSSSDTVSYPEDEDTLFGVRSLLTDNATSQVVPRSVTGRPSLPSVATNSE